MSRDNTPRTIQELLYRWRQTGSTTILFEGAKDQKCYLLCSSDEYAATLAKKYGAERKQFIPVSYHGLKRNFHEMQDLKLPIAIDNSFLVAFAGDIDAQLTENGMIISELKTQIKELQKDELFGRYLQAKNEAVDNARESLLYQFKYHRTLRDLNMATKEIDRIKSLKFYYIPLTLFLSFYFVMAVYILYNILHF